jgi:phosphotransferase system HPr (HPr) family protein
MSTPETSDSSETLTRELVVQNKMGIHARPAAMIVRIANTFSGEVWVEKDGEQVNGKSIMGTHDVGLPERTRGYSSALKVNPVTERACWKKSVRSSIVASRKFKRQVTFIFTRSRNQLFTDHAKYDWFWTRLC